MRSKPTILKFFKCLLAFFILVNTSRLVSAPVCKDLFFDHLFLEKAGETYLEDTLSSLELMRGKNNLINDTILIQKKESGEFYIRAIGPNTSPTNIAIDLLVQVELLSQYKSADASARLTKILSTLSQIQKHESSGLFFSWYSTDESNHVSSHAISSIDNLHLAIALWTIKQTFSNSELGKLATALFDKMNFSMFYDQTNGLIAGNFSYANGSWSRDAYDFANLGSEARLLYTAGWALGLFKNIPKDASFVERACRTIECEIFQSSEGALLKLWTGSAFQLFFPKIFGGEENYSPTLKNMFEVSGNFMIAEGVRRGLLTPAAHSPGAIHIAEDENHNIYVTYNSNAGNKDLVSSDNQDIHDPVAAKDWDATFTPHALFMAATANKSKILPIFVELQNVTSGSDHLYIPGMGWVDGYHISGDAVGAVIPIQIAVNQGMIALSLLQMNASDGMSASARALFNNPEIRARMLEAYQIIDRKINEKLSEESLR